MKKIIAILTALAVVSMAFAQTVSIENKIETEPTVTIGGLAANNVNQWGFAGNRLLREEVSGWGETLDARAKVWGRTRLAVMTKDTAQVGILNVKPQWQFAIEETNAAALLKPVDGLEIHIGSNEGADNKNFGPGIAWKQANLAKIGIKNVTGNWEGVDSMHKGIYVGFTGVENLWIGAGIATDWGSNAKAPTTDNKSVKALIKKGAYGPFQVGVSYDTDLFGVGAKYVGQFGGFNGNAAAEGVVNTNTDAKFTHHNIYAGFTFKGLEEAKVGTKIGAAVDFDTVKASEIVAEKAYTAFAVSANADMNFRNGITDKVEVTVGYQSYDGKKAKVLPFYIGNTLGYSVSDTASFSLYTAYMQSGLMAAMKTYDKATVNSDRAANILGYAADSNISASLLVLKPNFTFSMGQSTFSFGVETQVANDLLYQPKTASEWSYTSMHGIGAQVSFPMSWKYKF